MLHTYLPRVSHILRAYGVHTERRYTQCAARGQQRMRYVVVGAGVAGESRVGAHPGDAALALIQASTAGVCCARELLKRLEPGDQLTLVAPGDVLKVRCVCAVCCRVACAERRRLCSV